MTTHDNGLLTVEAYSDEECRDALAEIAELHLDMRDRLRGLNFESSPPAQMLYARTRALLGRRADIRRQLREFKAQIG